ncbi:glycerol-3-phosphate 1-O-acyltransferase PlsY [Varunaivibrio sulfuroxidans]|uniref:Glycerol-3-phosphate acyltransferase n=1 Tax=Varunaivibrio sulfuroxidans TaxID=1773489 RepID=A0A4R3JA69_9PROT|nr:glycerol-3-phosphate 1-O-acyltransferase PlsY [Varunaivibrio sulfuroxidans]TCS62502.1 acyl-phosphate glycerol-3-phosphate acyltransferase [Varunaivibrio sulfuroxidans]WES30827.1 glycerol-3-phosphate 1-O-acyltransferase PlsY [Varunaivibrio sulfuroxidans]
MNAITPDTSVFLLAAAAGLGYFLGAIPFGLVLATLFGLGDIRKIGSGNIGATNVLRTGNKPLALATLILDSAKGAIAVLTFAYLIAPNAPLAALVAGVAAVLGHNFPLWLRFKGGKGVATTLGTLLALSWPVGLAACGTWLLTAALFRYSSLAALFALGLAPAYAWMFSTPQNSLGAALLAVLAFARHHQNIRRLIRGKEPKIGAK